MANLNKVFLMGNLTADPELRYTPKGTAVTDIRLAINRYYAGDNSERQEETTFVDVTLWNRQAEVAGNYLTSPAAVKATWAALRASSPRELPAPTTTGSPVRPRTTIRPPCLPPTSRPATLETWTTKSRSKARTNNFFSQAAFPPCQAVFFMAGIPAEAKHRPGARRHSTAVP